MDTLFRLNGKVAIVTGGNSGIGEGIAHGFAMAGAAVVVAARDQKKTARVTEEIKQKYGVPTLGIQTDVSNESSIKAMSQETLSAFSRIDILVNNAGVNIRKPPQDFSSAEWDEVMDVNLKGAFLCCQSVYAEMCKHGGKIINVGSITSLFGSAKTAAYASSKGGIVQLTRSLAVAWALDQIQVNAILPGWIDTPLTQGSRKTFPGLDHHVEHRCPAGRWGTPADFAGPAVFLASGASAFVTGETLLVDGGYAQSALIV